MAILLRGKTKCPICEKTIEEGDEAVLFPHLVLNEQDKLYFLSDSACHSTCVSTSPLGRAMRAITSAYLDRAAPGRRICAVCSNQIHEPNDHLFIGYLADPSVSRLGKFNYVQLHRSHVAGWNSAQEFLDCAKATISAGQWRGNALSRIIQEIEALIGTGASGA